MMSSDVGGITMYACWSCTDCRITTRESLGKVTLAFAGGSSWLVHVFGLCQSSKPLSLCGQSSCTLTMASGCGGCGMVTSSVAVSLVMNVPSKSNEGLVDGSTLGAADGRTDVVGLTDGESEGC